MKIVFSDKSILVELDEDKFIYKLVDAEHREIGHEAIIAIDAMLLNNHKIMAIKYYRRLTQKPLKEAKEAVEDIEVLLRQHNCSDIDAR